MKTVFVILQAYSSLSVPELVQIATGYPLRFWGDWRHFGPGSNSNSAQPAGWLCVTCDVLLREGN